MDGYVRPLTTVNSCRCNNCLAFIVLWPVQPSSISLLAPGKVQLNGISYRKEVYIYRRRINLSIVPGHCFLNISSMYICIDFYTYSEPSSDVTTRYVYQTAPFYRLKPTTVPPTQTPVIVRTLDRSFYWKIILCPIYKSRVPCSWFCQNYKVRSVSGKPKPKPKPSVPMLAYIGLKPLSHL